MTQYCFFLLYIGEILAENIIYYRFYWHKCVMRKNVTLWDFLTLFYFQLDRKPWNEVSQCTNGLWKKIVFDSFEIYLCDLINEDDIMAIGTAEKNFPNYIIKSTNVCCTVAEISCRHVGIWVQSWLSSITWLLLWTRRDWLSTSATREKNQSNSAGQNCNFYFCSEMAATDTFVMEDSLHRRILKCI